MKIRRREMRHEMSEIVHQVEANIVGSEAVESRTQTSIRLDRNLALGTETTDKGTRPNKKKRRIE